MKEIKLTLGWFNTFLQVRLRNRNGRAYMYRYLHPNNCQSWMYNIYNLKDMCNTVAKLPKNYWYSNGDF